MDELTISSTMHNHDLICPITLDVYQDPVLAGDGHIYERNAIIRWIQQQGTSPITREILDINDLRSAENIKQLCQLYQCNSVSYSCETGTVSLPTMPMTSSDARIEGQICCIPYCHIKRTLPIIIAISLLISPFIIATSVIYLIIQYTPNSAISTSTRYPNSYTYSSTTYKLPNSCTFPRIIPLFAWNNAQAFNYTYYAKLYKASSNRTIITFAFRHDPSYWCLDNVSVIDLSTKKELVTNGQFDNNPSNGFFRCDSYGNTSSTLLTGLPYPFKGKRALCDGTTGQPDYLSQILNTKIDQIYIVSFWLQNLGNATNSARVVMSY